jgi:predicted solute-binding protein
VSFDDVVDAIRSGSSSLLVHEQRVLFQDQNRLPLFSGLERTKLISYIIK